MVRKRKSFSSSSIQEALMLSDCEIMTYQDEIAVAEEEYQIVSRKGKILFATFDSKTSVDYQKQHC